MSKILRIIIFLFFVVFCAPANAGPLSLRAEMAKSFESGSPLSRWTLTRAVLEGVDASGAAEFLAEKATPEEISRQISHGGHVYPVRRKEMEKTKKNIARMEEFSRKNLFSTPLFEKSRVIGVFLLSIFFLVTLAQKAYHLICGRPESISGFLCLCFRFLSFVLLLWFMRPAIYSGLDMSEAVAAMIAPKDTIVQSGMINEIISLKGYVEAVNPDDFLFRFAKRILGLGGSGGGWQELFLCFVVPILRVVNSAVAYVLYVFADVSVAILAVMSPIFLGLSLLPAFENFAASQLKSFVSYLFWVPLAAVFSVLSVALATVSLDTGLLAFFILSICYIYAAIKIPVICESLSTAVLASAVIAAATLPEAAAKGVTSGVYGVAGQKISREMWIAARRAERARERKK